MAYRTRTYLAGDWDHDKNAVDVLYSWKENKDLNFDFLDAHELRDARDTSLTCTIKRSLKDRLDCSKNFVLIVGNHTNDLTRGSCAYCNSYNSWSRSCGRGHYVSYESFIEYECRQAVEAGMKILILHNSPAIDKTKCPESIRYKGTHIAMHKYDFSKGSYVWDYLGIKSAFEKYLD